MALSGKSTGQFIGTIAGGIIGLAVPYIGPTLGAGIGGLIGGLAGGLYDTVTAADQVNEQESMADITFQTSAYGQAIPQLVGRDRFAGNIIDMGPKVEHETRTVTGGKGGGPRQITITKAYSVSLDIALCDTRIFGSITGIARAWQDNSLIYDSQQNSVLPEGWTLYSGIAAPTPDPTFETIHGVGNLPGYPFLCRLVAADFDIGTNPRVPNFTFELFQGDAGATAFTQVAISPTNGDVWVAVPSLNQVWRYDETTRIRLAVVQLSTDPPLPVAYGFGLIWQSTNYLWVADPVGYRLLRIDPGTNLVDQNIPSTHSFLSNQIESGGYLWIGMLDYFEVSLNDDYVGVVLAYDETGAAFSPTQDFKVVRSWLRLAKGSDSNIWTFSDAETPAQSQAIRIDHTDGNQIADIDLGVGKIIKDVLVDSAGKVWYCNYTDGTAQKIDPGSNTLTATVTVGTTPVQAGLATDGFVWVASEDGLVTRIHPTAHTTQTFSSDAPRVVSPANSIWAQGPSGAMWLCCTVSDSLQRFSTTGTTLTVRTARGPRSIQSGVSNTVWVVCESGDLQQTTDAGVINDPVSVGSSRLQNIVGLLCESAGLAVADYSVTALPNAQVIMGIINVVAIRSVLEQLATAHNFQLLESNRQLVFKRRGQEILQALIPESDLDAGSPGTEGTPGLAIMRIPDAELATMLSITYTSPSRNFQQNTQTATMSTSQAPTDNGRVVTTQVGLSDSEGKQRAQELLDRVWVERTSYEATVGRKYAYLEPMDRIQITARGITHTLTLTDVTYGRPGLLELSGKSDSAATQYVLGASPGVVPAGQQQIGYLAHTTARLLNLPALGNTDQTARYHVTYEYPTTGFPGVTLWRSADAGTSYEFRHQATLRGITGSVAVAVANADWHYLDVVSTLSVVLVSGTLASISDTQLYAGGNPLMLGSELLQFGLATLTAPNTYTCSRLLRGRRGTEFAVSTHGSNEQLAFLDTSVFAIPHALSERYVTVPFKPVTDGLLISTVTAQNFAATDANLVPWEIFPTDVRDIGTGDWTISWVLRSRFFGEWIDLQGVGYDPDHIGFRIVIYADATFTVIKRTTDTDGGNPLDPEATKILLYTSAEQVTDFGGNQTTLYYKAYQVASGGVSYSANITGV